MRNIKEITELPTVIDMVHQSCYRSHAILDYAKWMLGHDTPPVVVLQIIEELERFPRSDLPKNAPSTS